MITDGLTLLDGSIKNMITESGEALPVLPSTSGRLFYLSTEYNGNAPGLYVYDGAAWVTSSVYGGVLAIQTGEGLTGGGTAETVTIGVDTSFLATLGVTDALDASKVSLNGDTMTGTLNLGNNILTGVPTPVNPSDAVNKTHLDTTLESFVKPGDYGLGAVIPGFLANANTIDYSGIAQVSATGGTVGVPSGVVGLLINLSDNPDSTAQILIDRVSGNHYTRKSSGGIFGDWAITWTSENLVKTSSRTDTTAGSMLQVGDFGLGASIGPAISDYNTDLQYTGFYDAVDGTLNSPAQGNYGVIRVSTLNANNGFEIIGGLNKLFYRAESATVYSPYYEIWNEQNLIKTSSRTDTTAGSMLQVGDFGLGDSLVLDNNTTTSGFYHTPSTVEIVGNRDTTSRMNKISMPSGGDVIGTAPITVSHYDGNTGIEFYNVDLWHDGNLVKTTSNIDNTFGSMLKVGDFGLGELSVHTSDFDAINNTGFYRNSSGDAIGLPYAGSIFTIQHNKTGGGSATQFAIDSFGTTTAERAFFRSKNASGDWQDWVEVWHSDNLVKTLSATDNTDNSVVTVDGVRGWFGLGGTSALEYALSDLDDKTIPCGFYRVINSNPVSGTRPTGFSDFGYCQVYAYDADDRLQIYTDVNGKQAHRVLKTAGNTDWIESWTTDSLPITLNGSSITIGTVGEGGSVNIAPQSTLIDGIEGGNLVLKTAPGQTVINGDVTIDTHGQRLRFFESGSPTRGAFLDFTKLASGATSEIWHDGNLVKTTSVTDTTADSILKVGDFGIGEAFTPADVDMFAGTFAIPGVSFITAAINTLTNRPPQDGATASRYLYTLNGSPTGTFLQTAHNRAGVTYQRSGTDGLAGTANTGWYETWNENNLESTDLSFTGNVDFANDVGIGTTSPNVNTNQTTLSINDPTWGGRIDLEQAGTPFASLTWNSYHALGNGLRIDGKDVVTFSTSTAERVRIDIDGNVGIGTNNPGSKLHIDGANDSTGGIRLSAGAQNHTWYLEDDFTSTFNIESSSAAAKFNFQTNGITRASIDASGNLLATGLASANGVLNLDDNGSHNGVVNAPASLFINIDSDDTATNEKFVISKNRTNTSGGTELFTINEDGNVGIGTAIPPQSALSGLFVGSSASFGSYSGETGDLAYVGNNVYFSDGGYKYKNSDVAGFYQQINSTHIWYNAPAGTADQNVALEEVLRIDPTGFIGIGTGEPASVDLEVRKSAATSTSFRLRNASGIADMALNSTGLVFRNYTNGNILFQKSDGGPAMGIDNNGDVTIAGLLTATTKSFTIDHPTRPDHKLRYGSLEGPENGVYVRGRLNDDNTIELPDYWSELVHEDSITVDLTSIGKQHTWVEDFNSSSVTVGTDGENVNCFYVVYGERKDVEKLVTEFKEIV